MYYTIYYLCFITGDTGRVEWSRYHNIVRLARPSIIQSEDVMSKLSKEQRTGKEWWISLSSSHPESTAVIINNLNNCRVGGLNIENTLLDRKCVSILSEILKANKTIKTLVLQSSSLAGGIKQVNDSLVSNKTLEKLMLSNVTGITDEDLKHFSTSNTLVQHTSLKELELYNCNITDKGVRYICEALNKSQSLTLLNIGRNDQITSISTSTIAELIVITPSLTRLGLYHTSLNDDDIKTIYASLTKNTTIQELYLSSRHEQCCKKLDRYQFFKDRLTFV